MDFGLDIADVSPEREEAKEGAEDILAFGDPGDGFDVERVPGKKGGDEGAAPAGAGHAAQDGEKQQRVGEVQSQAGRMMAAGIECEQLAIEHVREPGQRMPISGMRGRECPAEARQGQALAHHQVIGDVFGVVIIDETAVKDWPIGANGSHRQKADDQERVVYLRARHGCGGGAWFAEAFWLKA